MYIKRFVKNHKKYYISVELLGSLCGLNPQKGTTAVTVRNTNFVM